MYTFYESPSLPYKLLCLLSMYVYIYIIYILYSSDQGEKDILLNGIVD